MDTTTLILSIFGGGGVGAMGMVVINAYKARADRENVDAHTRRTDVGAATDIVNAAGVLVTQMQSASTALIGPLESRLQSAEQELLQSLKETSEIRTKLGNIEKEVRSQSLLLELCEQDRKALRHEIETLRAVFGGRRKEDNKSGN